MERKIFFEEKEPRILIQLCLWDWHILAEKLIVKVQRDESLFAGLEEIGLGAIIKESRPSKRPGMTFSNNIKLFVGEVPRKIYQEGQDSLTAQPNSYVLFH